VAAPLIKPAEIALAQPAAPLFVPAQNLDMGVPRRILTATAMPTLTVEQVAAQIRDDATITTTRMGRTVPMLLLHDEYLTEYGGRLKAGSTLLVDQKTADRWVEYGVGVRSDASAAEAARVLPGRDNRYALGGMAGLPIRSVDIHPDNIMNDVVDAWVEPEERPLSTVPHEPWPEPVEISKAEQSRLWRQAFLVKG
jgi:hypothetical protein